MKSTLLDFSQRTELSLHGEVAADVTAALTDLGIAGIVVGAFARDLHLYYGADIAVQRRTEDIDFAFLVSNWDEFEELRRRLLAAGSFQAVDRMPHRFRHGNGIAIDLVPFGAIETGDRRIAWPPAGDTVMEVFGFRESLANADEAMLPGQVSIRIVSLQALALLKIVAWRDRRYQSPGKDATDLNLILRNYLATSHNRRRLWTDFVSWTESPDFDYENSGARMLGYDMRYLLDEVGFERVEAILSAETDQGGLGELAQDMNRRFPEQADALLKSLYIGFHDDRLES